MKKFLKIFFACSALILAIPAAKAQKGVQFSANYNIATPLSTDLKDYINRTSTRGAQASLLYGFDNGLRVGVQGGFNNFYQKFGRQVYQTNDGSHVSAVLSNTLQTIPILAKGEYSFIHSGFIRPYAGLGAGVNFINFEQYVGESPYSVNYTKPAFTGDIGVLIPFQRNSNTGIRISTSYNLSPFNEEGINRLDTWNVQAGFTVPLK